MSYDAFVRCNCWLEGKTKPFPFDYQFQFIDDCDIKLPAPDPDHGTWSEVHAWMKDCCEHPDMRLLSLRVANEAGMSMFREALEETGWERFPTLREEIPTGNGGSTHVDKAPLIMHELATFIQLVGNTQTTILVDASTNFVVQTYIAARQGVFLHNPQAEIDMGIDPNGFFIAKRHEFREAIVDIIQKVYKVQEPRQDLFRARRFEMRRISTNSKRPSGLGKTLGNKLIDADEQMLFIDLESKAKFSVPVIKDGDTPGKLPSVVEMLHHGTASFLTLPEGIETRTFRSFTTNRSNKAFHETI